LISPKIPPQGLATNQCAASPFPLTNQVMSNQTVKLITYFVLLAIAAFVLVNHFPYVMGLLACLGVVKLYEIWKGRRNKPHSYES
jgi:Sec-independent protein secretion pathway component TatC